MLRSFARPSQTQSASSYGDRQGSTQRAKGCNVVLTSLEVLPGVLIAVIVRTPTRMYWKSGEAPASSELDSATITSDLEGRLTQVSAMGKPGKSTA